MYSQDRCRGSSGATTSVFIWRFQSQGQDLGGAVGNGAGRTTCSSEPPGGSWAYMVEIRSSVGPWAPLWMLLPITSSTARCRKWHCVIHSLQSPQTVVYPVKSWGNLPTSLMGDFIFPKTLQSFLSSLFLVCLTSNSSGSDARLPSRSSRNPSFVTTTAATTWPKPPASHTWIIAVASQRVSLLPLTPPPHLV